jgi:hypothetical protein
VWYVFGTVSTNLTIISDNSFICALQALWGLSNLAEKGTVAGIDLCDAVLSCDIITVIARITSDIHTSAAFMQEALYLVTTLCSWKGLNTGASHSLLAILAKTLYNDDIIILEHTLHAIAKLGDRTGFLEAIISAGLVTRVLELLDHPMPSVYVRVISVSPTRSIVYPQ